MKLKVAADLLIKPESEKPDLRRQLSSGIGDYSQTTSSLYLRQL